jgi:hypothetical protein
MTKTLAVLLACFTLAGATSLQAQEKPMRFAGFNAGAQPTSHTFSTSTSFPLYDEAVLINSNHSVDGGAIFGVNGGYQVWRSIVLAGEYSWFSSHGNAAVAASIPNPLFFNQPVTVNPGVPNLERKEKAFHLSAMWFKTFTDHLGVGFSVGPSFIHVSQQLATKGTVDAGTQNLTMTTTNASGTAVGVNVGLEGIYMLTQRYGGALFVRYAGGGTDLPDAPDVPAGGFQIGLGARVRF